VIVWQDRRTAERCRALSAAGHDSLVRERTGLVIDPYFSATKLAWLLDEVDGVRPAAERGDLAFGTIDSFLLWRLTGGAVHATDATNAARTMLYDIHRQEWDDDLLALLRIPRAVLPEVRDCSGPFGATPAGLFGAPLPVTGIAGDQQAATVGQACFRPGMLKSTYGTGCFALLNTGAHAVTSRHRLLTTIAYRLNGEATYALEGSIFVAGAAVQWLRDGLKLIGHAGETEPLAAGIADTGGVYLPRLRDPADRARRARVGRLPDPGPAAGDGGGPRWRSPDEARERPGCGAGRRRHGRERLALPVPRRHARATGGAARGHRDHGARGRRSRGPRGRPLSLARGLRQDLAVRAALRAADEPDRARPSLRRLARRGPPRPRSRLSLSERSSDRTTDIPSCHGRA
jgi:hypothetical protein